MEVTFSGTVDRSFSGRMRLMDAIARGGVTPRFWQAFASEVERLTPADVNAVLRAVMAAQAPYQARALQEL